MKKKKRSLGLRLAGVARIIAAVPAFLQGILILGALGGGGYLFWRLRQDCGDTSMVNCATDKLGDEIDRLNPLKTSYGRGAGVTLGWLPGEEYDAGLCYPPCPSGYDGVGPVCWDFPKSKGRGAGKAIRGCDADMEKDGALCYPRCKDGYHGVGPVCWKD